MTLSPGWQRWHWGGGSSCGSHESERSSKVGAMVKGLDKENTEKSLCGEKGGTYKEERSDISQTCCFTVLGALVDTRSDRNLKTWVNEQNQHRKQSQRCLYVTDTSLCGFYFHCFCRM